MLSKTLALVDCNNFYVSCERVFCPKLNGRPVIVLSNNDGCAIARSQEAKDLGIEMGEPVFKIRELIEAHDVAIFSSNYTLYGDMSRRVVETLRTFSNKIEIYSIDESFVDLSEYCDTKKTAHNIRQTINQWVGIPTCVGLGPTKTLAKLANIIAKKVPKTKGVFDLSDAELRTRVLNKTPISKLWGVSDGFTRRLNDIGIYTALELSQASRSDLMNAIGIVAVRISLELQGKQCLPLELDSKPRKNIVSSRSFGSYVTDFEDMTDAINFHITKACDRLRKQNSFSDTVAIFFHTNPHSADSQYHAEVQCKIPVPTDNPSEFISETSKALTSIWKEGYKYHKAGVHLLNITQNIQLDLFDSNIDQDFDLIDYEKSIWKTKSNYLSQRYTTCWGDIPFAQ